jgi:CheY-like chemotaxis protein
MTKIIIVEDDPMISEIYQRKFVDSGFEVMVATTGEQVMALAKNNQVDVILLDLIMPKMDGFEVIEGLRKGEDYDKNIKIIVSSNLSQREDREKAMQLGANGFVAKSEYTPSELVAEVSRLLYTYKQQEKNKTRLDENGDLKENEKKENSKKILLIEDEEIFIEMFSEKLIQDGFEVVSARNGAWGIKEAFNKNFDLFIIDMVMPAMNGKEIVEKMKMDDRTKNIPIIVISASVEDRVAAETRALGVNCFFTKTKITPSELSEKARELTGK